MGYDILVMNWQDIMNPLGGGAEVHLHEIFKRIVQKGHRVTLICCRFQGSRRRELLDGIEIIRSGYRSTFNYSAPWIYLKLIKERHIDIVVDDINKIPFFAPVYVKKPIVGIIHHLFGESIFLEAPRLTAHYVSLAEKLIPRVYRRIPIAVVSDSTKSELVQKGFSADRLHVIHNGVDLSCYHELGTHRNATPLIGYLGRIKKYKSVDHLLIAFKKVLAVVPDARLLIMGDGDYLPILKKMANTLQIDGAVIFAGASSEEQKIENLNKIWFSVNPSPKEGWGLTVIESNACGVPVIAADSPGLRDSVIHGKTGLTYPYGDSDRLAALMVQLIQQDDYRGTLSRNSLEWTKNFSWDRSTEQMLNLLDHSYLEKQTSKRSSDVE